MKKQIVETSLKLQHCKQHRLLFTVCACLAMALVFAGFVWLATPKIPDLLASPEERTELYLGEKMSLTRENISQRQLERVEANVVWSSSNEDVLSVAADGTITTRSEGDAIVTATLEDKSYTYPVSVNPIPTIVVSEEEEWELFEEPDDLAEAEEVEDTSSSSVNEVKPEEAAIDDPQSKVEPEEQDSSDTQGQSESEQDDQDAPSEAEPEEDQSQPEPEQDDQSVSSEAEPEEESNDGTQSEVEPEQEDGDAANDTQPESQDDATENDEDEADEPEEVVTVPVEMCLDDSLQLELSDDCESVTWASSDDSIVTIDESGLVTACGVGSVTITAYIDERVTSTTSITVLSPELLSEQLTLYTGCIDTLELANYHQEANWVSSDPSVATVSSYGTVSALSVGTATISVVIHDVEYSCALTVYELPALSGGKANVNLGSTKELTFDEELVEGIDILWTSSDESIVTVDEAGTVTGVAPGTATVSANVSGCLVNCDITVNTPDLSFTEMTLIAGSIYELELTGANKEIAVWSSSDESVATVTQHGTVTASGTGDCVISVSVNGYQVDCDLHIPDPNLNQSSVELTVGGTTQLSLTHTFSEDVTWVTSNSAVATVSEAGLVTAVAPGSCNITVTANGITALCAVTVSSAPVSTSTSTASSNKTSSSSQTSSSNKNSSSSSSSSVADTPITTSASASAILSAAASISKTIISDGNWHYANTSSSSFTAARNGSRKCDCAQYVSWVCQKVGLIPTGTNFYATGSGSPTGSAVSYLKKNASVIKVGQKACNYSLKPGDICLFSSHVMIYAGKNSSGQLLWYNGGKSSTSSGRSGGTYTKSFGPRTESHYSNSTLYYVIRTK